MDSDTFLQLAGALPEPMLLVHGDGRIVSANRAALSELGEEVSAKTLFDLVADPPQKVRRYLRFWSRTRETAPASLTWRTRGRLIQWQRCEGALVRPRTAQAPALLLLRCRPKDVTTGRFLALKEKSNALAREISERRRAEAELESEREWFRTILASIDDGVVVTDAHGCLMFLNPVAEKLIGWKLEEARGARLETLLHLIDGLTRRPLENPTSRVLREGSSEPNRTLLVGRDGTERPIDNHGAPIYDGRGDVAGVVLVLRDMTERQHVEEKMLEAQKLESLGLLAGGVAHDFNNLLTGILGNASLAQETVPPDNPARRMLDHVLAAAQNAAALTRQMLTYAGRGRAVTLPVNLSELARDIGPLLRTSIGKRIDLRLELEGDLPLVTADPSQMQQVIMNLVINGAEAIGEDRIGWVVVSTKAVRLEEREVRRQFASDQIGPGRFVCLEVRDNGAGMDEATRSRIFDPFFTTKFSGRGLGLSVTAGIVRALKGAIKLRSVPGGGSTFQVFFPAAHAQLATPAVAALPVRSYAGSGTVLVVDDEEVVRRTAAATLERCGFDVLTAEDGRQAVEVFRGHSHRIVLVLLDLTMPVMSGEQTLRLLQRIRGNIRVLLSSGFNEPDATRRLRGLGLAGFLQKPYTAAALADKVREILSGQAQPADHAA